MKNPDLLGLCLMTIKPSHYNVIHECKPDCSNRIFDYSTTTFFVVATYVQRPLFAFISA